MDSGYRQRGYQHGHTSQEKDGAGNREESPGQDKSVFVKEENGQPYDQQRHACNFAHLKGPGDVRDIVEDQVRQRWILVHIWNPVMHDGHGEGGEPAHK